jgi:hypothetical protein
MAGIPEELPRTRTSGTLPPDNTPTELESRTKQAVEQLFTRHEATGTPHILAASALTGQEPVVIILRRLNIDTRFSAAYEYLHKTTYGFTDDPQAQYDLRTLAISDIRQALSNRTTEADALIQALPAEAHHVSLGGISIYFNDTTAHVLGAPQGQSAKSVLQQALNKGVVPPGQVKTLQKHIANPNPSTVQHRTIQQAQASQKKAQAAAKTFGTQLSMVAIELHLEEPQVQEVEKAEAQHEEVGLEESHHPYPSPHAKGQKAEEREESEQTSGALDLRERTEKEASQKRKAKAQASEELASRTQKQRKKKQEIAHGERREGERQKDQIEQL